MAAWQGVLAVVPWARGRLRAVLAVVWLRLATQPCTVLHAVLPAAAAHVWHALMLLPC
jgi:hypothetical protein